MSDQKIKIRLPNARQKLQPLFPEDSRGDIKIVFGKKSYKLQKAFLRLQSGFFKKKFASSSDILQIKQQFNEKHFSNVLKCFYGYSIEIIRNEILDYYPVIKYLEVQSLLKLLREDMISKADSYDIFILLQLAHKYDQQDVFQICLSQLEKEGYEQLRYAKLELFKCPMELFKMIIKTHNRMKSQKGKGIQYMEIDQLIRDFSQEKRLNESQYQELKFELIDKKSLTSQQYKQIFLDDVKRKKSNQQYKSMMKIPSNHNNGLFNSNFSNNILAASKLTESVIEPLKQMDDGLTLQMENTFQKKKNEELQAENAYLLKQLKILQENSVQNKKNFDDLKQIVMKLQKQLQEKEKIQKQQTLNIKKLTNMYNQMKNELTERSNVIKKLQDRIGKLQKQPGGKTGNPKYLNIDQDEDKDSSKSISSQISQIIPGHLLKDMVKSPEPLLPSNNGFKKFKQPPAPVVVVQENFQEQLDQDEIEELYFSRLQFNEEPKGCPKKFLPKLANFLTTDGFQKKKLDLIFRRTANNESFGQSNDIRNKNSLLVIICTKLGQIIGGFTSITISKNSSDFLADQNAFIFSLTKNQKFKIKKSHINQAIYVSPEYYLIGFSNDVTIPLDCIKTQSQCHWPASYDNNGQKRSSRWLTGQETSFSIRTIEIYEVRQQEMVMDLL